MMAGQWRREARLHIPSDRDSKTTRTVWRNQRRVWNVERIPAPARFAGFCLVQRRRLRAALSGARIAPDAAKTPA
jgi:hypothetical protein